jgi:hypothetical protein
MTKAAPFAKLHQFYESLAEKMKEYQIHFIWSKLVQAKYEINKTIFIPFDPSQKEDTDGYGMYLLVHEIHTEKAPSYCLIALASLQLANTQYKKEVARLLHEINLHLPIPGWILNDSDDLLHFKYVFSGIEKADHISDAYVTLIGEILNGLAKSFPLIKETLEGKPFKEIKKEVATRLN